jgi:hypothetical protein
MMHDLVPIELVEQIKEAFSRLSNQLRRSLTDAMELGRLLTEARPHFQRGEWGDWLESTLSIGRKQAEKYMLLWSERETLERDIGLKLQESHRLLEHTSEPPNADFTIEKAPAITFSQRKSQDISQPVPSINEAVRIIEKRKARAREPEVRERTQRKAGTWTDPHGTTVTLRDDVANAMADTSAWDDLAARLRAIKADAKLLAGSSPGYLIHWSSLEIMLKDVIRHILYAKPYAPCPYCHMRNEACDGCKGHGWVGRILWSQAPEELKRF